MLAKRLYWAGFILFVACALYVDRESVFFGDHRPITLARAVIWATFAGFTAYTVYCSRRENLFASVRKMANLHWGRQVGLDLYIGLSLSLFLIYLNEGTIRPVLLWLAPVLAFANLATLLYFAIHIDSIVARFNHF